MQNFENLEEVFKAYDIRGIYKKQIDEKFAKQLALAYTYYFGSKQLKIATAYDVRESSKKLYETLNDELASLGHQVHALGLVPTPVFYNYIARKNLNGGIMVTASHNPPDWAGFKLCKENAEVIGEGNGMEEIKKYFFSKTEAKKNQGEVINPDAESEYIDFLKQKITLFKPFNIVVDIGNGSTFRLVPKICKAFNLRCKLLFAEPDGTFPNRPSEPTDESLTALKEEVKKEKTVGVAFDGDGDRAVMVDEDGKTVRGDVLFALLAKAYSQYKDKKAVIEVNFSEAIENYLKELGYEVYISRVGHSFITKAMVERGAIIGGEVSGHYYFKDTYGADDSIFAFVKAIETMQKYDITLREFIKSLNLPPSSDVITITVQENLKDFIIKKVKEYYEKKAKKIVTIDGIKAYLDGGWVLVRKSNTMPQIKIKAEGERYEEILEEAKKLIIELSKS